MKPMFLVKASFVALLIAVGICFLVSCDRFSTGTLSGNMKKTYRSYYDPMTGKTEFSTIALPRQEVTLLQYNDTMMQKDKELREDCSPKITTAHRRCSDKNWELNVLNLQMGKTTPIPFIWPTGCEEGQKILNNCTNSRNNNALSYAIQKAATDVNGAFIFPDKIPYGKYILFATSRDMWWLVHITVNQPQANVDLTEKNAFMLNLN